MKKKEAIETKVENKLKVCKIKADYYEKLFLKWQNYESILEEAMSLHGDDLHEALAYALALLGDDGMGHEKFIEIFGESFKDMIKK
jgi:hypothetical protein